MDNVMKDMQTMKIVNWKRCALHRDKWKSIAEQAKAHIELPVGITGLPCSWGK
jgi:hypothetical protein